MPRAGCKLTQAMHERASRMWRAGIEVEVIGERVGLPASYVYGYAKGHREDFPPRVRHVSPDKHERINELHRQGRTNREIAEIVGVNRDTVARHLEVDE